MSRRLLLLLITIIILGSMLACVVPGMSGGQPTLSVADQLAMTVAVELTRAAGQVTQPPEAATVTRAPEPGTATQAPEAQTSTPTSAEPPTATPVSTHTPAPANTLTVTNTPIPCNRAEFITDVTVPDGTEFAPNANFTKTWRIRNAGSCSWTAEYRLVFAGGEKMGAADSTSFTAGNVSPGNTVDISINLKSPGSEGAYQGDFRLKDGNGNLFGIGESADKSFWLKIKVVNPILPPAIAQVSLSPLTGESGSVRSNGQVNIDLKNVGDTNTNTAMQLFISFDISGIPAGSTITEVKVNFTDYDKLGDPWGSLGCLRGYEQNYGDLDASDFFVGNALGALTRWCSDGDLGTAAVDDDLKNVIQAKIGSSRLRMRLQFNEKLSDNDNTADAVRFGVMRLVITYTMP